MLLPRRLTPTVAELVAFEAAVRHGSLTQAAEELALTQSAISKQVRQLEERLRVPLFERTKRRLILTETGKRYYEEVRGILAQIEKTTHGMLASKREAVQLNVAVLPSFASQWLIPRLPRFLSMYQDFSVNLVSRLQPFDFRNENVDCAIHYGWPYWPNAEAVYLFHEEVIPVASKDYAERLGLQTPADIERAVLLQISSRPSLWADWFAEMGVETERAFEGPLMDQFSLISSAAQSGLGVGLLPAFLITRELADGQLVHLSNRRLKTAESYYLVTPMAKRSGIAALAFRDWLELEAMQSRL